MRNPFRKKPAPADVLVLHGTPCPACDLADFRVVKTIGVRDVLACVNCGMQWFGDVLAKTGYTYHKGYG